MNPTALSADDMTHTAYRTGLLAIRSGDKAQHQTAVNLHMEAAQAQREAGNRKLAAAHESSARMHMKSA
jgi:hypothetical protein